MPRVRKEPGLTSRTYASGSGPVGRGRSGRTKLCENAFPVPGIRLTRAVLDSPGMASTDSWSRALSAMIASGAWARPGWATDSSSPSTPSGR